MIDCLQYHFRNLCLQTLDLQLSECSITAWLKKSIAEGFTTISITVLEYTILFLKFPTFIGFLQNAKSASTIHAFVSLVQFVFCLRSILLRFWQEMRKSCYQDCETGKNQSSQQLYASTVMVIKLLIICKTFNTFKRNAFNLAHLINLRKCRVYEVLCISSLYPPACHRNNS